MARRTQDELVALHTQALPTAWKHKERAELHAREMQAASAKRTLELEHERQHMLVSQCEPVDGLNVDRTQLALLLEYVRTGNVAKLKDSLQALADIRSSDRPDYTLVRRGAVDGQ